MGVDVLAIGAHMGDEVAWGMALAAHRRQGLQIGILSLTPGEKDHHILPPAEYAVQKRRESEACADVLGAQAWALNYKDGELLVNDEVKLRICDVIREARPRLIISHWCGSMHKDHAAAAENLPDAVFYAAQPGFQRSRPAHWVPRNYYAEHREDLRHYDPEIFLQILPEDIELWEKAMRSYAMFRGEISPFPYLDYYHSLARCRGCEVGYEYAATFAVPPESRRRRVQSLVG